MAPVWLVPNVLIVLTDHIANNLLSLALTYHYAQSVTVDLDTISKKMMKIGGMIVPRARHQSMAVGLISVTVLVPAEL
jgi:hypothetical protein